MSSQGNYGSLKEPMKILYSAEVFKDFIYEVCSPSNYQTLLFNPSTNFRVEGDHLAFLSDLPDKINLETLRDSDNINLLLPVREGSAKQDIEEKLKSLTPDSKDSYIISNHIETSETFTHNLVHSRDRWRIIESMGAFVNSKEVFSEFPDICMTVASELLTNAFYNAPRDKFGRSLEPDRTKDVIVGPNPVQFSYGDDGKHIWMKVSDPFGTFNRYSLLNHLLRSVGKESIEVNLGRGGAGIGIFMIFRWASQLLFLFEPNQETTVVVKLLKTKRRKVFEAQRTVLEVIQRNPEKISRLAA
jgi:hypothetical protein